MKEQRKMLSKKVKQEQEHDIRQDVVGAAPIHIGDDGDKWDWKRDQGFTKPIVLILCPMRYGLVIFSQIFNIYHGWHRLFTLLSFTQQWVGWSVCVSWVLCSSDLICHCSCFLHLKKRHWAYSIVSTMVSLLGADASVANLV